MAKVKQINKARKDFPEFGIKKGEPCYVWSMKTQSGGITRRSKTYPRQSQLTLSEYKSQAYQLNEKIEDFCADNYEDLEAFIDEVCEEAEGLSSEVQDRLDSMPEGLQQGPTGELLQSRIDSLETFTQELQGLDIDEDSYESIDYAIEELKAISLEVD